VAGQRKSRFEIIGGTYPFASKNSQPTIEDISREIRQFAGSYSWQENK